MTSCFLQNVLWRSVSLFFFEAAKYVLMLNETLYSVLQCPTPAALHYISTIIVNKKSSSEEEDILPQTTSMLRCSLSATGSDLEGDLLEWERLLEAVLPDKKAQAFRVSDEDRLWKKSPPTCLFSSERSSLSALFFILNDRGIINHLTVLRTTSFPACRYLLLKPRTPQTTNQHAHFFASHMSSAFSRVAGSS